VPPLAAAPSALARFIERNLSKAPESRASDGRAFAHGLLEAARESELDPGLSSRTRRGHAVTPVAASALPASAPVTSRSRAPWLMILLCFVLGAGVALLIATRGAP
jgi:hypothetical protein